ncbi:replication initiator protein A [Streptococcus thermophilus]|uniref:Replication initiator protein A (RepA) N-terminus n=1 Tax=Streptococcus thermophilus TaxID=1308 RepID=A0A8D6UCB1_STRTR|nr:replication initiator protein A [Streptococcus thermophilus]ETW88917.1 replication initiation protein [Streptococcus thermophilus MTH17CL396]CAD0140095.1 Replication initiator protein A (RepA) N-terminus [Streptococcus thermophilus]CAD0146251.1 Replication initiator protein A (RepA) N-terminus [Streptococcus thermophilus]CAD0153268.1 Replication initiator protein A (RepA) N-terminus [Streptococcus thermophilus]
MAYGRISLEQVLNSEDFYQLPKMIIKAKYYRKLRAEAKLMFALFRDRITASLTNVKQGDMRFVDECGDIFIYYSIEELVQDLGWGRDKIIKLKKELIRYGLIDEVRQGVTKANRIYVKNIITDINILNMDFEEAKPLINPVKSTEVGKCDFKKSENSTSRSRKMRLQEVVKLDSSKNKESKNKKSNNISSRKPEKNSNEFSQSAETNQSLSQNQSTPFVEQKYYSLLQIIADKYNEQLFGFPNVLTMTHNQKMKIGQYLASGYVTSAEVLNMIERIPKDSTSPLAYLLKSLENLKQERLYEQKSIAHLNAENYYSMKKEGDENV